MLDVGIVGCGAIGTILARFIAEDARGLRLVSVFDRHIDSSERLTSSLTPQPTIEDVPQMAEHVDIIVECASTSAVPEVARTALSNGCQVMIMSVGALTDPELKDELVELAEKHGTRIHIPSGAIVGIDGLKAAGIVGIDQVVLKTKKTQKTLKTHHTPKKTELISILSIKKLLYLQEQQEKPPLPSLQISMLQPPSALQALDLKKPVWRYTQTHL